MGWRRHPAGQNPRQPRDGPTPDETDMAHRLYDLAAQVSSDEESSEAPSVGQPSSADRQVSAGYSPQNQQTHSRTPSGQVTAGRQQQTHSHTSSGQSQHQSINNQFPRALGSTPLITGHNRIASGQSLVTNNHPKPGGYPRGRSDQLTSGSPSNGGAQPPVQRTTTYRRSYNEMDAALRASAAAGVARRARGEVPPEEDSDDELQLRAQPSPRQPTYALSYFNAPSTTPSLSRPVPPRSAASAVTTNAAAPATAAPHPNNARPTLAAALTETDWNRLRPSGSGAQPWECGECDYATGRKDHLKRHFRNLHDPQRKMYTCKCGFSCPRIDNLRTHQTSFGGAPDHTDSYPRRTPKKDGNDGVSSGAESGKVGSSSGKQGEKGGNKKNGGKKK